MINEELLLLYGYSTSLSKHLLARTRLKINLENRNIPSSEKLVKKYTEKLQAYNESICLTDSTTKALLTEIKNINGRDEERYLFDATGKAKQREFIAKLNAEKVDFEPYTTPFKEISAQEQALILENTDSVRDILRIIIPGIPTCEEELIEAEKEEDKEKKKK